MRKILVVEDSPMVMKIIKHVLSSAVLFECDYAESFAEAKSLTDQNSDYFAALVDLNLPDATDGEVVDHCLALDIPTVVLTASFDADKRSALLGKGIVDYVIKEGRFSYLYARGVVERLVKNQSIKVLVVDDSDTARKFVSNLLRLHMYQVLEASDGVQAIKMVVENPDLQLLITDFNMPRMDGCELVKNIRVKYEKSALVIIGLSSENESALSARFIKNGANDFLRKPFNHEEFFCRVTHNVEFLEHVQEIQETARRDDLTGLYNRHYFYGSGRALYGQAKVKGTSISMAIMDLDNFHEVNDLYGYDVGDQVIVAIAHELAGMIDKFLFARAGGKEFYLLLPGLSNEQAVAFVERVRQIVVAEPVMVGDHAIEFSLSAGVSTCNPAQDGKGFDLLIGRASSSLRRAKKAGGDLVFGEDEFDE